MSTNLKLVTSDAEVRSERNKALRFPRINIVDLAFVALPVAAGLAAVLHFALGTTDGEQSVAADLYAGLRADFKAQQVRSVRCDQAMLDQRQCTVGFKFRGAPAVQVQVQVGASAYAPRLDVSYEPASRPFAAFGLDREFSDALRFRSPIDTSRHSRDEVVAWAKSIINQALDAAERDPRVERLRSLQCISDTYQ